MKTAYPSPSATGLDQGPDGDPDRRTGGVLASVVVPTHGRPAFLARALESVLAQTWSALEIVVVDDNGRDTPRQRETAALVAGLAAARGDDREIRYLVNERNGGGGFTRNAGVAAARGEYIGFLDDDDEWLPEFLARGIDVLDGAPADIVYCDCIVVDDGRRDGGKPEINDKHAGDVRAALIDGWCPSSTSLFVLRRAVLEGVVPFDPALASFQDYDCWLGLSERARFAFHDEPLVVKHRHRAGQITANTAARRDALEVLRGKWNARLSADERRRFAGALARLEHDILRMEYRNAVHERRWGRATGRAWRYVTGRGSAVRNLIALARSTSA